MSNPERWLSFLLRSLSAICLLAFVPLVMPYDWMTWTHSRMGLGIFPTAPIAEYLARCTSGLSAFYGGLLWVLSADVHRYRRVIQYQALAMIALSSASVIIGIVAGIPLPWLLFDAVGCWGFCVPTCWLSMQVATAK